MPPRTPQSRRETPTLKHRIGVLALNLVLGTTSLVLLSLMVWSGMRESERRGEVKAAMTEARALYESLESYYKLNRGYPNAHLEPRFELDSLEPLKRRGYYRGRLPGFLLNGRVDAYDAPDDQGQDREFWVEMTLEADPNVRLLVVKSDDAPMSGGKWLDGVYLFRNGRLEAL